MAQPTSSDSMPTPPDVNKDGTADSLGAHRFDQHYGTDQPVGPEPEEPSTPEPAIDGIV